ncbi:hypothetical protein B0H63DRAFT_496834 [Podospora didyma]|uniref:Clr5 domain-containing protein n=1 Tax=Podospora didyma TaxID=330526 RepID=A0AAE0K8Y6_9PEZI|nr:hypothetical protein B0H63DRAFT_496834 [Podospora didyma]
MSLPSKPDTPELPPEKPLIPASALDWEAKKDLVFKYYMQQNLILNDVIEIMQRKHNFKATARMYKGMFQKWAWTKYNKSSKNNVDKVVAPKSQKRKSVSDGIAPYQYHHHTHPYHGYHVSKPAPATYHHPHPPSMNLIRMMRFPDEESFYMESTLNQYNIYISTWVRRDAPWTSGFHRSSILQDFRTAKDHFTQEHPVEGGECIQRAFNKIQEVVSAELDIEAIWDCCLAVPQLALSTNWTDILLIYTEFLYKITALKQPNHPISKIAKNLHRLASNDPGNNLPAIQKYIESGWKLWINLVSDLRGKQDRVTIHLKRGYVILMNPEQSIVGTLIDDFNASVQKSLEKEGEANTTNHILELEQLLVRMYIPLFSTESTWRARTFLTGILDRIKAKRSVPRITEIDDAEQQDETTLTFLPSPDWDYLDRYLFFSVHNFLAAIADSIGEYENAADLRRKSLESPRDRFWVQTAENLEEYLKSEGRHEEANEIQRQRYEVVPAMGDLVRLGSLQG